MGIVDADGRIRSRCRSRLPVPKYFSTVGPKTRSEWGLQKCETVYRAVLVFTGKPIATSRLWGIFGCRNWIWSYCGVLRSGKKDHVGITGRIGWAGGKMRKNIERNSFFGVLGRGWGKKRLWEMMVGGKRRKLRYRKWETRVVKCGMWCV